MKQENIKHPCYNENCIATAKIIHLPVAPKCNIKCNFCNMQVSSCELEQPGISSMILKPENVVEYINSKDKNVEVVGIAGPGDALFNEETFDTLRILKNRTKYPTCICTNGLLLEEKLDKLINLDLDFLSVTINAMDYNVAEQIYSKVIYKNKIFTGIDGAKFLLDKQQRGLKLASENKNFKMKINTVYIPGVNDKEIIKIAKFGLKYKVDIMNIIPVIPNGKFKNVKVDKEKLEELRKEAGKYISQKKVCGRCRADACGYIKRKEMIKCQNK